MLTKQFGFRDATEEDEEGGPADIEEMIEALLEEEFPAEEEDDMENEDTEELATERLLIGIQERFVMHENNLSTVMVQIHQTNVSTPMCTIKYLYFTM